jgi:hypothetical protein
VLTLPLVGRVDRRSEAAAGGVGVVVFIRGAATPTNNDPTPSPYALRASGADPPHKGEGKTLRRTVI